MGRSKGRRSGGSSRSANKSSRPPTEQKHFTLQAVLFADSFESKFLPITQTTPKALLPLCNRVLLDYALESARNGGVEEVFILCKSFSDQILQYLRNSKQWQTALIEEDEIEHDQHSDEEIENSTTETESEISLSKEENSFSVIVIQLSDHCRSVGEAIRMLATEQNLRSDPFIVLGSDVLTTIRLAPLVQEHCRRFKQDKRTLLTMVMREAYSDHRIRISHDNLVVGLTSVEEEASTCSQRIVAYSNSHKSRAVPLHSSLLSEFPQLEMRYDLMDCEISICSLEMITLFEEQFDMLAIRPDLLRQVLSPTSVMGYSVYAHIVHDQYAAHIATWTTYHSVAHDLLHRWIYDFALDAATTYQSQRSNVYISCENVTLPTSSTIGRNSMVGRGTVIGEDCVVDESVIGEDVVIGKGTHCVQTHLWNNVRIGANVELKGALVAKGAVIEDDCVIERGCIIGFNVRISRGTCLAPHTKWYMDQSSGTTLEYAEQLTDEDEDDEWEEEEDEEQLETDGKEFIEVFRKAQYRLDTDVKELQMQLKTLDQQYVFVEEEDEDLVFDDASLNGREARTSRTKQRCSNVPEELMIARPDTEDDEILSEEEIARRTRESERQKLTSLQLEIKATLERNVNDDEAVELECGSLKLSHDASLANYCAAVFWSLFQQAHPSHATEVLEISSFLRSLAKLLYRWQQLVVKYSQEATDQVQLLYGVEKACTAFLAPLPKAVELFAQLFPALYNLDIVQDEGLEVWTSSQQTTSPFYRAVEPLVQQLLEEESEEDDDDD